MRRIGAVLAVATWLGLVGFAFRPLLAYQSRPGIECAVVERWPTHAKLAQTAGRPTLVMFIHPQCPCSSASLDQLQRISTRVGSEFRALVVVEQPASMTAAFAESANARHAAGIKGVTTVIDNAQTEAKLFGATTSGDTFVYDSHGALVFHGGITPGRGHEGDCAGFDTVCSLLRGHINSPARPTPSFGCALFNH